jgi:Phosphotransferase System HPr (HPr) Family
MYSKNVMISNPTGLHARPATLLVKLSESFKSDLQIINGSNAADPKSIFSLLAAGLRPGLTITVKGVGADEHEAVEKICSFIDALEE